MDTPTYTVDLRDAATRALDLARAAIVDTERLRARLALAEEAHAELWAAIGRICNDQADDRRTARIAAETALKRVENMESWIEAWRQEALAQRDANAALLEFTASAASAFAAAFGRLDELTKRVMILETAVAPSWPDATAA